MFLANDGLTAEGLQQQWARACSRSAGGAAARDLPVARQPLAPEKIQHVVHITLHEKPPNATHWSMRNMAAAAGVSYSSVQRIWRAHGLKPHLVETFKVSHNNNFATKVKDVVGLYLDPPDKALVLCIDERSQNPSPRPHPTGIAHEEQARRYHDPTTTSATAP